MASPDNATLAQDLARSLAARGIPAYGLRFNAGWRGESRSRIDSLFRPASHALFVVDAPSAESAWFAYAVGSWRGCGRPLALYRVAQSWLQPAWLADLHVLDAPDEVLRYYEVEQSDWNAQEERRQSRASLLENGISWHLDSLVQVVRDGDAAAVDLFLKSGFPPDTRDKNGVPLLCLAARSRHHPVLELLLERGAPIDQPGDDRGYTALMDAAQQGDGTAVAMLLARGADPDVRSKDGQTALVLAVGRNDAPMSRRLIESGADPDIPDKLGLSARKYAGLFKNPDILSALDSVPTIG